MSFGILLIVFGILIAIYPQLLSIIVAAFLIMTGITLTSISYHFKKSIKKETDNPFVDFFIRF
jgi:Flp pilus assembly protein TadB